MIQISFYAGFQALEYREYIESIEKSLQEEGFSILQNDGTCIRARSAEGVNFYGQYRLADRSGVEYSVSVQYPDGKADEAMPVIEMAASYPYGPSGTIPKGEALE